MSQIRFNIRQTKGPATRNDFVNDIVNDARANAIFATLKAIVDDEKSTISSTISLRVAWPLDRTQQGHIFPVVISLPPTSQDFGLRVRRAMDGLLGLPTMVTMNV